MTRRMTRKECEIKMANAKTLPEQTALAKLRMRAVLDEFKEGQAKHNKGKDADEGE